MATDLTVQEMTLDDLHTCWELDQRCFPDGESYEMETFRHLLTNPEAVTRKVELFDGTMIGFVVGVMEPGGVGHVISLGVAPGWRRQGIGRMLMESIERGFTEQGASTCRLEVRADNYPAQQLYRKMGYSVTQELYYYYSNGDDALVMVRALPGRRSFWRFRF
jgi:ribosomal-protein-alanine acetyltransferase